MRAHFTGHRALAWAACAACFLFCVLLAAPVANAQEGLSLTPAIVTKKGAPRDIIKGSIELANETGGRVDVYLSTEHVDATDDHAASTSLDRHDSLAQWIEVTRAVIELEAGERKVVPYMIQVSPHAQAGTYHARIIAGYGTTRAEAQERADQLEAETLFTLEVLDNAREKMHLGMFLADKNLFAGKEASFSYIFENTGDKPLDPSGEIRIFNRRGEEVGVVPIATDGQIAPSKSKQLASVWDAAGRFGKYKAFLDIEYGKQGAAIQDTVYFWVFPWREILIAFVVLAIGAMLATYLLHVRLTRGPDMRMAYARSRPEGNDRDAGREDTKQRRKKKQRQHINVEDFYRPKVTMQQIVEQEKRQGRQRTSAPDAAPQTGNPATVRLAKRTKKPPKSHVVSLDKRNAARKHISVERA